MKIERRTRMSLRHDSRPEEFFKERISLGGSRG
jgi:hypothetical protein